MNDRSFGYLIFWFFLICFIVSFILLGWLIKPFLSQIVLAAVITGLFNPIYKVLLVKDKINPPLASFITCLLVFLLIFVPIVFFVGILSKEAYDLYLTAKSAVINEHLKNVLQSSKWIERINLVLVNFNLELSPEDLNHGISELGKIVGLFLYDQARQIASNMMAFLINFFLMLVIIYYLLIEGDRLVAFIIDLSPLPKEQDQKLIQKFKDMAGAILLGNGLGGLIQGTLGGIVFSIFGIQSPFLWGVIMGLLAFLPIIGIGIVFIPAAIYLFLKGRLAASIFFVVFYMLLSGGVEYIFKPKLVGKRVQMHTLIVFLTIIGGLKLFGILGIVYGPLIATAFLTLTDIYHSSYQNLIESGEP
jgi:predicted PurR-regulated permease PerM